MAVPQEVCKATRAVLLSSKKGVILRDFTKDYKSLFGSEFPWSALGYPSPLAMLRAMTTCAQLTYDATVRDYRVFGVAEGHSYISTPLLNAQWSQKKEELLRRGRGRGKKHKSRGGRRNAAKHGCVRTIAQGDASQNHPIGVCVRYKPEPDLQWEKEHWKVSEHVIHQWHQPTPSNHYRLVQSKISTLICTLVPHYRNIHAHSQ